MSSDHTYQGKILLIEDESDISIIARTALKAKGYDVKWTFNGYEGIEIARNNDIDLILLDVSMPDENGYEVLNKLKIAPETKNIPVVFFSALVQKNEIDKGLKLGALGYIQKPFDPEALPQLVDVYLQGHNGSDISGENSNSDQYKSLVSDYLRGMSEKLLVYEKMIVQEAFDDIEMFGHRLAGSGATYGFSEITSLGSDLEKSAKEKDLEAIKILYIDFFDLINKLSDNR